MDAGAQQYAEERMRGKTPDPDLSNLEKGDSLQVHNRIGLGARFRKHFAEEVTNSHADVLLLLCCVISGFVDSAIYNGTVRQFQFQFPCAFAISRCDI